MFTAVGIAAILLGLVLLVAPHLYLGLYVDVTEASSFPARRLSPAIIGLGGILVASARLPKGGYAVTLSGISALVWFTIAATGLYDYATGTANTNILVAAASEIGLGLLFVRAARSHRAS